MFPKFDETGATMKLRGVRATLGKFSLRIEKQVNSAGSTTRFIMGQKVADVKGLL